MSNNGNDLKPLYRGDSREYDLAFTDKNGDAIPITGWTVYFTVKKDYKDNDEEAIIKKDITIHGDPENGKTKFILLPSDTKDIKPDNYCYDIQVKRGAEDNILTVVSGVINIRADVTRRTD